MKTKESTNIYLNVYRIFDLKTNRSKPPNYSSFFERKDL